MRSLRTGRIRHRTLRDASGDEIVGPLGETIVVNDPAAAREAARLGLGIALLAVPAGRAPRSRVRRARAPAPALVRGCRRDLPLLRKPDTSASQDTRLRRLRGRGVQASAPRRKVCRQPRMREPRDPGCITRSANEHNAWFLPLIDRSDHCCTPPWAPVPRERLRRVPSMFNRLGVKVP
jgi:hypothetical protein